jgi:hypothetical protein
VGGLGGRRGGEEGGGGGGGGWMDGWCVLEPRTDGKYWAFGSTVQNINRVVLCARDVWG